MSLCQPGGGASCGACCGLYNFRDHSREGLHRVLARQTEALAATPRTPEAFRETVAQLRKTQPAPAFAQVRVCPALGFLDGAPERVGCLAHPLQTGGADLRDCGVYTSEICQSFECPSFIWLTDAQARLVRAACPDWYLYGLIITDVEFVRGVLGRLEALLARPVDPDAILRTPAALEAIRAVFALKEHPAAAGDGDIFGRFVPDASGEPVLRQIDYEVLGARAAPEDDLVLCLGIAVPSREALDRARSEIRLRLEAVAAALDLR
jgi:hypothetical protein